MQHLFGQSWAALIQQRFHRRQVAVVAVPACGRSNIKEAGQRKLAAGRQILRLHERDSVYELRVVDAPGPFVGLYAQSIILITEVSLTLLSAEELQAFLAHEVGHEYIWKEYEAARQLDVGRLQELELFCDMVSVVTLRKAGIDPSHLINGIERLERYTQERFEPGKNASHYVPFKERRRLIQAMIKWSLKP
jgi:hypothetical protein